MAGYDLKTALAKVGAKPMSFSYFTGEDHNQIVVSAAAPTPALLKEIEKECGKLKCVLKGRCFREGDLLVFATKTPPAPQWKMQLANVLKTRKCPGASHIELRQLGEDESGEAEADGENTSGEVGSEQAALEGWQTARAAAIAQLQALGTAMKGFQHPKSTEAIILVKAIQANLTAKPDTPQKVTELEKYLTTDRIITDAEGKNGFGITVSLRKPLLDALGKLKPLLPKT